MVSRLSVRSPAKINLYLKVLNKRRDGYHNIETLFERISLSDKIVLEDRSDRRIKVSCDNPALPRGPLNLAYRSAKLLRDKFNLQRGVEIRIAKRIPVGSGLGGGSANAASVLTGLNELWGLHRSRDELAGLGAEIGSDVPFFIYNVAFACASGKGDRIMPLEGLKGKRLWHILVVPRLKVMTPVVYKAWDRLRKAALTRPAGSVKIFASVLKRRAPDFSGCALFNSLEQVTLSLHPQVSYVKDKLVQLGLRSVLMSGSGPAVFGMVSSRKEAQSFKRRLERENRSWRVFAVHTL